jgi:hypothetical protein
VVWTNDLLGGAIGNDMDDFRTNAFSGTLRWRRWVLTADDSMLTDYRATGASRLRSDELTVTVGYEVVPDGSGVLGGDGWMAVGAGTRSHGDFGGNAVQNRWHDLIGVKRVELDYDDAGTDAVGYAAGRWTLLGPAGSLRPYLGDLGAGRGGVQVDGGTLGSDDGGLDARIALRLVVVGVDGAISLGMGQEWHVGHHSTAPAAATARNESGPCVLLTTSAGGWFFNLRYDLDNHNALGSVGWMWQRPPGRSTTGIDVSTVEGLVGMYEGAALGMQYRWHTAWLDTLTRKHASLLADYRFGEHNHGRWSSNAVVVRQPTVGVDMAMLDNGDGFSAVPFCYVAAGLREESVVANGRTPRFPNQKSLTGVIQGGVGIRLYAGAHPTAACPVRYGVSMVYDGWLPFRSATASNAAGTDHDHYLQPGCGLGGRLAAVVLW